MSAVVSTADFGPEFSGGQALAFTPQGTTGTIVLDIDPKPAHNDRVEVWANLVCGPDGGLVKLWPGGLVQTAAGV